MVQRLAGACTGAFKNLPADHPVFEPRLQFAGPDCSQHIGGGASYLRESSKV